MYILSEEGELLEDHSADPLIPRRMCYNPWVEEGGKIFTLRYDTTAWLHRVVAYSGEKWLVRKE